MSVYIFLNKVSCTRQLTIHLFARISLGCVLMMSWCIATNVRNLLQRQTSRQKCPLLSLLTVTLNISSYAMFTRFTPVLNSLCFVDSLLMWDPCKNNLSIQYFNKSKIQRFKREIVLHKILIHLASFGKCQMCVQCQCGSIEFSEQLTTYVATPYPHRPKSTSTLTSHLRQNSDLGEGQVSQPEISIDLTVVDFCYFTCMRRAITN